jgi:hypothetical protein
MAACPSCNAPLKDGDWTCGSCGAPAGVATAPAAGGGPDYGAPATYGGPGEWGPEYQPRQAPAAAPASAGASGLLKLVIVGGAVAIVAVILVWFFVLRGPATSGEEFLGNWTASTQQGIATVVVAQGEEAFSVTMSGNDENQKVTVPAHLDGTELVITMDDFSQMAGAGNAEAFKATLKALAGDFTMRFSSVDTTRLDLRIVGESPAGQDFDETIPLSRETAATI